jgi:division protein CdvB (Snf7/Vps24/ESCRT-III family)
MDWDEAMDDVVDSFTDTESKLRKYIAEYGAALSTENRSQIDTCMSLASNHQYAKHEGEAETKEAKVAAEGMLKQMKEIEQRFLIEIRN